jgi:hypothetical protein
MDVARVSNRSCRFSDSVSYSHLRCHTDGIYDRNLRRDFCRTQSATAATPVHSMKSCSAVNRDDLPGYETGGLTYEE